MVNFTVKFNLRFLISGCFSTICGVVCSDGVITGTEKIVVNKMMLSGTDKRTYSITKEIGCVVNGLVPDGRFLMYRGKEEAAQYAQSRGSRLGR